MSISKRHHFTPRYYLKGFRDDQKKIWRKDDRIGKVVYGDENSFGLKKNWNTLRNPPCGYDVDWAEKQISMIDGFASISIFKLRNGDFTADMRPLAYAISLMQHHQPTLRANLIANHRSEVSEWSEDQFLIAGLRAALSEAPRYIPRSYALLRIEQLGGDSRFLTSSNPLVEFSNKNQMFFPISNDLCLFMMNEDRYDFVNPQYLICEEAMIKEINKIIIENSWQYLYSSRSDFAP